MLAQGKPCAFNTPFGYIHGWTLVSKKVSADTASRGSIGGSRDNRGIQTQAGSFLNVS